MDKIKIDYRPYARKFFDEWQCKMAEERYARKIVVVKGVSIGMSSVNIPGVFGYFLQLPTSESFARIIYNRITNC